MMDKEVARVRKVIMVACKKAKAKGVRITRDSWLSNNHKRCCVLGAVCLKDNVAPSAFWMGQHLKIGIDSVNHFIDGFDSRLKRPVGDNPWYLLGRDLAKRLIKPRKKTAKATP